MKRNLLSAIVFFLIFPSVVLSQTEFVRETKQKSFPRNVPAGNYSGITHISGNEYAVVSDKSDTDGFFIFEIDIDTITGEISSVVNKGFRGGSMKDSDCEGIAYRRSTSTFFISRESDNIIAEYDSVGKPTGREMNIPDVYRAGMGNYGFESLAYDDERRMFWTVNESTLKADGAQATPTNGVPNVLRLQSFDDNLQPLRQFAYLMDAPEAHSAARNYAMGVSEIACLGGGRLLVLEREFFVPKIKLGAFVTCKLYEVCPDDSLSIAPDAAIPPSAPFLPKRLLHSFTTRLSLFNRSLANYEGMCLGPVLTDGSRVLILVSDSQNQYAGVLKDWFKTIIVRNIGF